MTATHDAPPGADTVIAECATLTAAFVEAGRRLYLVGGIVRDLFASPDRVVDVADLDLDFTTDARPPEVRSIIGPFVDNLWTQGERFGTIAAHVGGRLVEVTTHRAEAYDPDSRKPAVVFADDVRVDLSRRDFTVNAMAIELTSGPPRVIDPFGGLAHLRQRRLATPLSPVESFSDDPLRMLRAARFTARLGLTPDADLVAAMTDMAERLGVVSAERVRDELDKLFATPDPSAGIELLLGTGLLARFLPELAANRVAHVAQAPPDALTRLAVALAGRDAATVRTRLRALRRSRTETELVGRVVALVPRLLDADPEDPAVLRRVLAAAGDDLERVLDAAGAEGAPYGAWREGFRDLAAREDVDEFGPALDGEAVMRLLDLDAGPDVGRALSFLRELRIEEGPMTEDGAAQRLRAWWAARRD